MKKEKIVAFFLILALFGFSFVSAQVVPQEVSAKILDIIKEFFGPLFGALFNADEINDFLFARILLVILLTAVIFSAIKKMGVFKEQKGIVVLVSVIVSLLAVRYLSEDGLIAGVLLPYGTLGISILTLLPFIIFFFFIQMNIDSGLMRRLGWILYGIAFIVLWISRSGDIASTANWIYFFGIIAVILSFMFDGTIHGYFRQHELQSFVRRGDRRRIAGLQAEHQNIENVNTPEARERRNEIRREIRRLGGHWT